MNLKRLIAMSEMCCHTESERHELLAAVPVLCRRLMAAESMVLESRLFLDGFGDEDDLRDALAHYDEVTDDS